MTVSSSLHWLLFASRVNLLLVFVPLGVVSEVLRRRAVAEFVLNFLAIIPLAKLLGDATEQVSLRLGQTLGGLMKATDEYAL